MTAPGSSPVRRRTPSPFLSGFYNGGFADLIEATFHEIRKGDIVKPAGIPPPKSGSSFFGVSPLKGV